MLRLAFIVLLAAAMPAAAGEDAGELPPGWSGDEWCDWHSRVLRAAGEPPLWDVRDEAAEIYRFLYIRAFHGPIVVTMTVGADGGIEGRRVRVEEHRDFDAVDPCDIFAYTRAAAERFEVASADASELLDFARRPDFAGLGAARDIGGRDGSEWVIEIVRDGRWRGIWRWSAWELRDESEGNRLVGTLGKMMLEMSGGLPEPFY